MKQFRTILAILLSALAALCALSCKSTSGSSGESSSASAVGQIAALQAEAPVAVVVDGDVSEVGTLTPLAGSSSEGGDASDEDLPPTIKLLSKGSILPTTANCDLLFSSVGYARARVRVKKVFPDNILQYMQVDRYDAQYELGRVSRVVADTVLVLGAPTAPHLRRVKTYALSMDELVKPAPGAIFHVEILGMDPLSEENYYFSEYYFGDYSTYSDRSTDLLVSDLALVAKRGDRSLEIFAFDILSGKPVPGARVKVYDAVQQELSRGSTDRDGRLGVSVSGDPRFVAASFDRGWSYLDIKNEKALSTSNFDVGGTVHQDGIKAYIFGEMGVWRPGDTIHVSTVLLFDNAPLPSGHPLTAELRNPDGALTQTLTARYDGSGIYHFPFVTEQDAPTGRWTVNLLVGSASFNKSLRVETVKPNRLDIDLDFGSDIIEPGSGQTGQIAVKWLYGAPGSDLKVSTGLEVSAAATSFKDYPGYDFKDDARSFETQTFLYKDQQTDSEGACRIGTGFSLAGNSAPGLLKAGFTVRVFEPSGEFSTGYSEFKLSPYRAYVGIKTEFGKEYGDADSPYLELGASHKFDVVTLDARGKAVKVDKLRAEIFHVDWSWWWSSSDELASYMSGSSRELVYQTVFATPSGKASFEYDWKDAPSGIYYVRVTDTAGGHAASMVCNVHENWEGDRSSDAATRLAVSSDKSSYDVGSSASVSFPSAAGATALVSVEKGGKVLESRIVSCSGSSTSLTIPVTPAMLPNAYVCVTLVQPHGTVLNDAPIRLYGVHNIAVADPSSKLRPVIDVPAKVKPESSLNLVVKEQSGRPMDYVVALVDEGLLSLTGYQTPDAWAAFYKKEALRVRTWDVYDNVIGAYGGRIEQLFAVGGDDEASGALKRRKAERFTPVVRYLGPFSLKAGKSATHRVELPQYIGSLRAMVIATDGRAQGSVSKDVEVSKPLMVTSSAPRTVCVGEKIKLPVTVLSMEKGIGAVKVSVKTDGGFKIVGPASADIRSDAPGQQLCYFELEASDKAGIGTVEVTAESSSDKSSQRVEMDVLYPNPEVTRTVSVLLEGGKSKDLSLDVFGVEGSNAVTAEFSAIPPADLSSRMRYLLNYPYGCIEQTVSCALPQLYLGNLTEISATQAARIEMSVKAAIRRMQSFRRADGTMSYWPGEDRTTSPFGTVYAYYFLIEAQRAGYAVPSDLLKSLSAGVAGIVKNSASPEFVRAFGLYALSSAGKPQRGVMNLMRSEGCKANNSAWLLAAAYAMDGKKDVSLGMIASLPYTEKRNSYYTDFYGSELRNVAIAARVYLITGKTEEAFKLALKLSDALSDRSRYMSTQTTAWALQAMCEYAGTVSVGGVDAEAIYSGKTFPAKSDKSVVSVALSDRASKASVPVSLVNKSSAPVYAVLSVRGVPAMGEEKETASGLKMSVKYVSDGGKTVDVASLERGKSFKAVVSVTNTGKETVENIALAHRVPSGWEIRNDRVYKADYSGPAGITYQDFRDDRVYSFFDLAPGASVEVEVSLTATYPGVYYLPAVSVEAMYDSSVSCTVPGRMVEVK